MARPKTKSVEMSEERLVELKCTAKKILENLRGQMLSSQPFIGSIALKLDILPTRDLRNPTASTDGKSIFFDIDFLSRLADDQRVFVLAHEVWHVVMLHFTRLENRIQQIFNIATDIEVNQILRNSGFNVLKECMLPSTFNLKDGESAEWYYDELMKNAKYTTDKNSFDTHCYDGNGDGQNGDNQNSESNQRTDKYGKVGYDKDYSPNPKKEQIEKIREMVVSAVQQCERSRGEIPAAAKSLIKDLLEPKVSWKEILSSQITSAMYDRSNWNVPNRRFAYSGTYLPSHSGESLKIGVAIDTSGSCTNDVQIFLTEINNIVKTFGNYEIHLIQCDTEIQDYTKYDEYNTLDIENNPIEVKGFGGTTLHPIFDYISLNELEIDSLVVFTDGGCEQFKEYEAPDYPVLWMLTSNDDASNIEFGQKIKFIN